MVGFFVLLQNQEIVLVLVAVLTIAVDFASFVAWRDWASITVGVFADIAVAIIGARISAALLRS